MATKNEYLCDIECSAGEMAGFLGLTARRLQQLAKDEIIPQYKRGVYKLQDVVQAYTAYLKAGSSMRGTATHTDAESTYNVEKTGLTRVQRLRAERDLKVVDGELHRSEDVRALVGGMVVTTRSRLLDVANKVAPKLVGQKDIEVVRSVINGEVEVALQSLADYDPEPYKRRNRGYKGGDAIDYHEGGNSG